jgi:hypothetical protein
MKRLHLEYERQTVVTVARIQAQIAEIFRVLNYDRLQLERLTEAVCGKIRFKGPL